MKIRAFVVVGLVALLGAAGSAGAQSGGGIADAVRASKGGARRAPVDRQTGAVTDETEVASRASAASVDFVCLPSNDQVNDAYAGGTSSSGTTCTNLGMRFSGASVLDPFNGCCSPSPKIAWAPNGTMLISSSNGTPWSYIEFYTSSTTTLTVQTYASNNGTGSVLQTFNITANISSAPYNAWVLRQFTLSTAAQSVRISGATNRWGIDNVSTSRAPSLASISPTSGTQFGGTTVTLTGTGFSGASSVRIGGTAANFSVISDTQITATTPLSLVAGARDVAVTTPFGNAVLAGGFTYIAATPTLTLAANAAACNPIGTTVAVNATLSGVVDQVVAGQISVMWDPAKLTLQSIAAGDAPFTQVSTVNQTAGTATILVSVAPGSSGVNAASRVVARLNYQVSGPSCDGSGTSIGFFPSGTLPTQFTNGFGGSIRPVLVGSTGFKVDNGAPTLSNVPANVTTQAQAGEGSFAVVSLGTPTATDDCSPTGLTVTGTRSDGQALSAKWPVGTTTVTWSAADACGNTTLASTTVTVQPFNTMQFTLNWVNPFGTTSGATRSVSMSFTGAGGTVTRTQSVQVARSGQATFSVTDLPIDTYTCVMVEDPATSLKRRLTVSDGGSDWVAAAGTLLLGDVIHDGVIDVLDWGAYVVLNPNADLNADGVINATDGNIILANFGRVNDAACTPSFDGPRGPITAITVSEVVAMGLPELAGADLNSDGWIDEADMRMFGN